jgi:hypothetical protein
MIGRDLQRSRAVATRRVATRLTDDDVSALERLAQAEDRTVSAMIRRLVGEGISRRLGADSEPPREVRVSGSSSQRDQSCVPSVNARVQRQRPNQAGGPA